MSVPAKSSPIPALETMIELIRTLRGPDGCPWDRKQTPRTIANYLVEEVYELVDAIDRQNAEQVLEELGDVLFQVHFIAEMYSEMQGFDLEAVIRKNVEKMRRRHPHVFGDAGDLTSEQVRQRWHEIKQTEKKDRPDRSALDSVPRQLPPLTRAHRICERAARYGVDWADGGGEPPDLEQTGRRFHQAVSAGDSDRAEPLLGAMLLAAVQAAHPARIHPDTALKQEVDRFERRFRALEDLAAAEGKTLNSYTKSELQRLWSKVATAEEGT
ncbi:MAG TPA: nucleoside triphosphate pyrophosphohydrolase [Desulfobacterales bacterium]